MSAAAGAEVKHLDVAEVSGEFLYSARVCVFVYIARRAIACVCLITQAQMCRLRQTVDGMTWHYMHGILTDEGKGKRAA